MRWCGSGRHVRGAPATATPHWCGPRSRSRRPGGRSARRVAAGRACSRLIPSFWSITLRIQMFGVNADVSGQLTPGVADSCREVGDHVQAVLGDLHDHRRGLAGPAVGRRRAVAARLCRHHVTTPRGYSPASSVPPGLAPGGSRRLAHDESWTPTGRPPALVDSARRAPCPPRHLPGVPLHAAMRSHQRASAPRRLDAPR
jgi:hypothetical protein